LLHERGFLAAAGFRIVAGRAVRYDVLERIEKELELGAKEGTTADTLIPRFVSYLGCSNDALVNVLEGLGWKLFEVAPSSTGRGKVLRMGAENGSRRHRVARKTDSLAKAEIASPFASLAKLKSAE
jgi:hypothetical protein